MSSDERPRTQRRAGKVEVTTRMTPGLAEALRRQAASHGCTVTGYIVRLIELDLAGEGTGPSQALVREALLGAIEEVKGTLLRENAAPSEEVFAQAS